MVHHTYCDFHLGDNLFHLHFLRKLAERHKDHHFSHSAHDCHLDQLREVVLDLENVTVHPLEKEKIAALRPLPLDAWKNAGAGTATGGFFERDPDRNDYYGFYLRWFEELQRRLGFGSEEHVLKSREDLLFDYPALWDVTPRGISAFDILFVNSQPCSGQFPPMNSDDGSYLESIIDALAQKHRVVTTQQTGKQFKIPCTRDFGLSVTGVGSLSLLCNTIIMIGTGPAWPTMNKFNCESVKRRFVLFNPEHVSGFENVVNCKNREELEEQLAKAQLL